MKPSQFSLSLPLRIVRPTHDRRAVEIREANGRSVCICDEYDAPQLVRSVNCHAELLAACKDFRHEWEEFLSSDYEGTILEAIASRTQKAIQNAEREL